MVKLLIRRSAKGYGKNDKWVFFDQLVENFASVQEAENWIRENYGKSKRTVLRRDSKKIGYVIGFRNSDFDHESAENWIERDFVEFVED